MVNLEYYRVFYYVAKFGSVSKAAQELCLTQPAVSQAVKNLEDALGGALFVRTPKGMSLTPEGEVLRSHVAEGYERIVLAEAKFRGLSDLESGEVRIGASDMTLRFFLLPHLERFHTLYPKVRIKVTNAPTPETLTHLASGKIDFGLVSSPVEQGTLELRPLRRIQDTFVAGRKFSALAGRKVKPAELADYPLILLEPSTSTRRHVDAHLEPWGIVPEFELATSDLIVEFAERGLGVGCVVKDFADAALESGRLFEITLSSPIPPRTICLASLPRAPMSPAGRKFLSMLTALKEIG